MSTNDWNRLAYNHAVSDYRKHKAYYLDKLSRMNYAELDALSDELMEYCTNIRGPELVAKYMDDMFLSKHFPHNRAVEEYICDYACTFTNLVLRLAPDEAWKR